MRIKRNSAHEVDKSVINMITFTVVFACVKADVDFPMSDSVR